MPPKNKINQEFIDRLQEIIRAGFKNAAKGFSSIVGLTSLEISDPKVTTVPLSEISYFLGGPETDAVGIYLKAEGDINAQVMLILPIEKSLEIVDLLMDVPAGTTTRLGTLERSALGEVGNMTGTFFLNAISELVGMSIRPTPPAVMVDMVGAILDVIIATMGQVGDQVMLFQTTFLNGERELEVNLWVVPDPISLKKLIGEERSQNE